MPMSAMNPVPFGTDAGPPSRLRGTWAQMPTWRTQRSAMALAALSLTLAGILFVHPASVANFLHYFLLWHLFVLVLHRDQAADFAFAFSVSSAFIAAFYVVQTTVFPDSYGTTSPFGAWTDDSYFYALAADTIPVGLELRDYYYMYTHPFTSLIRALTPWSIDHPMDVIFFQAGVSALLATASQRFAQQIAADRKFPETVYLLTLFCPFLMMNGGVILLRDTFAAALFIYSLSALNDRRYLAAAISIALQLAVRPGTALILVPAYAIIYSQEIRASARRHKLLAISAALALLGAVAYAFDNALALIEFAAEELGGGRLALEGRDLMDVLSSDPEGNTLLLAIQELPFPIRVLLNGAYIFAYPFLSLKNAFPGGFFDLRSIALNLITPIYAFWLNAWFVAGILTRVRLARRQVAIVVAVLFTFLLIGTYSMQTRHKTIIYPLYYVVVAIGISRADARARRAGYACSGAFLALQVAMQFR